MSDGSCGGPSYWLVEIKDVMAVSSCFSVTRGRWKLQEIR